jgi:hypothetical protein
MSYRVYLIVCRTIDQGPAEQETLSQKRLDAFGESKKENERATGPAEASIGYASGWSRRYGSRR